MTTNDANKLLVVIVRGNTRETLISRLKDAGYRVTTFSSVGGFLRRHSTTLLVGLPADQVETALTMIRTTCPTPQGTDEHTATIFVLRAGQFVLV
ncbi:MAG: cyclic-di-AMP receptor [Anaerolineae bacterium]|nr:cyclic-di-AMP receptor [Anaerolineae bacterium]